MVSLHNILHRSVLVSAAVLLLALPWITAAQSVAQPAPVQYIVAPEVPGPNQTVYIKVEGVGSFLGNSVITWTLNGKVVSQGAGDDTLTFTTGGLGTKSEVSVSIASKQYDLITRSFSFIPSSVVLLWEADTTVPPLYLGKALYSPGASVKVVAFPVVLSGGKTLNPASLSYQWILNEKAQPAASGLGRNTFQFTGSQLNALETVGVVVYASGEKVGKGEVIIPAREPQLVFYGVDALRGVLYNRALGNATELISQESTVHVEPYFFSRDSVRTGTVTYEWLLNGTQIVGPDTSRGNLTLRQSGNGGGSASLSVTLQNTEDARLLQQAHNTLSITFGQSQSLFESLLGL